MICPCEKKGDTSVVDSRLQRMVQLLDEEDFVFVVNDLLLLKESKFVS